MSEQQAAIVTGGSRGIGAAVVTGLPADGIGVTVNCHANQAAADELVAKIGTGAIAVRADIGEPDQIRSLFDATEAHFGGVDILVFNANTNATFTSIADARDEQFDATFLTNTRAMFVAFREAANRLRDGGRIVFISSGATTFHLPGFGLYSAMKATGEQFVHTLAHELGPRGITVNSVLPGPTST